MNLPGRDYHGNCHCGSYRFKVRLPHHNALGIVPSAACDCRLCKKQGYQWWLKPASASFEVTRDDGWLVEYQSSTMEHKFCGICGTGVLGRHFDGPLSGGAGVTLNARTLRDFDPYQFEQRKPRSDQSSTEPVVLPHSGSCDCGLVNVELLHVPGHAEIKEDNCSICRRNAWVGIYPRVSEVKVTGAEHLTDYRFGRKFMGHPFCRVCGVHVVMNVHGPPQEVVDQLPDERREMVRRKLDVKPINVRVLDGVDLLLLEVERTDEGTEGYETDVLGLAG
ncbi:glutathione-dependent formaldehyde-activating gfa [Coniochaeta sp. 2T2.1]|nr:glutathione-dependent formaldehyde-activating gfa [Coniochaeta sp. 2T2.1]